MPLDASETFEQLTHEERGPVAVITLNRPEVRNALSMQLSDELVRALRLPTFEVAGMVLLKRLTLVLSKNRIEKVFYPVFPPDKHAEEVVAWLTDNPVGRKSVEK